MSDRDEESIGKMRTWGHEESVRPPQESAWNPGMSIGGLTTRRVEGIDDDGRTDGARRWKAGEEILGRYVVERELGQGGMGVVYGCFDKTGGVKVAVKCLPPELGHNSVEMEEVRENFELVVGLRHPNIAGVRTLEKDGRGEYYLVMDVAEGENLRAWLRRKWKAGGVSLEEAVGVLRQVASALDYAHGEKVVHRDVKPGNVMIDGRGRVKVLDFGLAAQIRTSMSRASHEYRGTAGTGPYMAPEQWRGRRQDGKTDQYALGVMAYEMLAGHLPFENGEVSVLREVVLKEEAEDIPGVPKGAMASIRRAMSKSAEDRFSACGAFVEGVATGSGRRSARGKTLMGWVVALVAAAVAAVLWGWMEGKNAGKEWLAEKTPWVGNAPTLAPEKNPAGKPLTAESEVVRKQGEAEDTHKPDVLSNKSGKEQEAEAIVPGEGESKPTGENSIIVPRGGGQEPIQQAKSPAEREGPRAGATKVIPLPGGATMEMVWCPPGKFTMERTKDGEGKSSDGGQHEVLLPQGFWLAKYEVTQAQWRSVMGDNPSGFRGGDDLPVENVSWEDCQMFCKEAELRLPTEAEWEYACRAGSPKAYSWGDALKGDYANCNGNYPYGTREKGPYRQKTEPVGSYPTNAWGLCDMHGNVWEWCSDKFGGNPEESGSNQSWWNDSEGTVPRRVLRGGSWINEAQFCRSSYRGGNTEDHRDNCTGFRPAGLQP